MMMNNYCSSVGTCPHMTRDNVTVAGTVISKYKQYIKTVPHNLAICK